MLFLIFVEVDVIVGRKNSLHSFIHKILKNSKLFIS